MLVVPTPACLLWGFRRSKYDILMEKLSGMLSGRAGQMETLGNIREELVSPPLLSCLLSLTGGFTRGLGRCLEESLSVASSHEK